MKDSDYNQSKEKCWRGDLTAAEAAELQAWLAQHPGERADWETEVGLTEALGKLPAAPVPSNFTSRVMEAVEREAKAQKRPRIPVWTWLLRSLLPRAAVAAFLVLVVLGYQHQQTVARREKVVDGVKIVSGVSSLPSPEILQDFDTIRKLGATPGPDQDLIALMK